VKTLPVQTERVLNSTGQFTLGELVAEQMKIGLKTAEQRTEYVDWQQNEDENRHKSRPVPWCHGSDWL